MEISLCLIVKDEEDVLYRCLESVANIVDEIIVVDTGSSDGTKEIAQKFQAKIYDFKWIDDFAAARNYSFSKATKEYILWMDADDYFTNENNQQLLEIKHNTSTDIDVINMIYSLTRNEKGETLVSLRRNRIVKRSKGYQWIGRIHEYLEVYGNIEYSNIYINHGKQKEYTNRNLLVFEKMVLENQSFSPRDTFYYASELYYNRQYEKAILKYKEFLQLGGWIEDKKTAVCNMAESYLKLDKREEMAQCIIESLQWSIPKADTICKLALYFFEKEEYQTAIFWYQAALKAKPTDDSLALTRSDFYTWIPAIQICVCYCKLGEYVKAYYYNELTKVLGGNIEKVNHNQKYIKEQLVRLNQKVPDIQINFTAI